jgi:rod shape-determining protein MreD
VRTAAVLLGVGAALTLQTTLSGMLIGRPVPVNLVVVAVVYVGLAYGAVSGMLAGAVGGLAQDALAGGVIGVGGLAKTLIGFLVGVLGAQFIVAQAASRFVMFEAATIVHQIVSEVLHAVVDGRGFSIVWSAMFVQALVNAVIGVTAFWIVERGPDVVARRRMRRASFSKRRF